MEKKKYYYIGEVAKFLGVHDQTIRKYEKAGLIKPLRTKKNTRQYRQSDIRKITAVITMTQEMGLRLNGVKLIFELAKEKNIDIEELLDFIFEIKNKKAGE